VQPVIYDGIQNQSLMIEDAGSSKGAMTYPHPSIVKFIERHVEMECAEADKMELGGTSDNSVRSKSEGADVLLDEPLSATLQPVLPMDFALEDELVGDALIGVRVRRLFREKGKKGKSAYYSGTVTKYKDPYYWVDYDDGDYEELTLAEIREIQIMSTNTTIAEKGSDTIDVTRAEFPVQLAYSENKGLWEPVVKALFKNAVAVTKSMRPCSIKDIPAGALLLPASVVCKVKADPKQAGHVLVRKGRLVVQHSKKRFPSTDPDVVHATVATAKNVKTVLDLSTHIGKPHQQGDIETAFPMTPLWPDLVGTIFLKFPKCLELPEGMVFEMLTFMEGFQLSNSAFDARLNEGLVAYGFRFCPNDSQLLCINTPEDDFLLAVKVVDNLMFVATCDALKELLFEAVRSVGYNIIDEATDKFLGSELERHSDGSLHVHQGYHARKLFVKYDITGESAPTPLSSSFVTENYIENGTSVAIPIKQYQTILGDILWLIFTRYDIQHAMSALSQKTHYCSQRDYDEAIHSLKYVLEDPDKSLIWHPLTSNLLHFSVRWTCLYLSWAVLIARIGPRAVQLSHVIRYLLLSN